MERKLVGAQGTSDLSDTTLSDSPLSVCGGSLVRKACQALAVAHVDATARLSPSARRLEAPIFITASCKVGTLKAISSMFMYGRVRIAQANCMVSSMFMYGQALGLLRALAELYLAQANKLSEL